jgi:hypothetical protein
MRVTKLRYALMPLLLAASHQESGNSLAAAQCWEQSLAILTELNHPDAAEVLARLRRLDTANAS